jgi:non-specific serine/threonine protein kinase/serine/threonine-protein kinase
LAEVSFPGYRILGEIHRGGQGVVYQALQESTRRKVAIKVPKEGPFADPTELARFDREVDVLSRLNHPHIVAIHDRGLSAGHAYYVMDYIAGRPLDAYVAGAELSVDEILELFIRVCAAVNVAHLRGVIHRDLKPGNIRVDEEGQPRILDFGLAKLVQEAAEASSAQGMTLTGQFVGSLPWASPEQVGGGSEGPRGPGAKGSSVARDPRTLESLDPKPMADIDIRTDVYSLGVILYQLLTGRFPYPVTGRIDDVIRHIAQTNPLRPTALRRGLDRDLELIVLKALAKEPERRYQSVGELTADIGHYLAHEPITATSPSAAYRLRKFVRRNRGAVIAGTVVAVALVIATGVSITFGLSETRQRKAAEFARSRAETAEGETKARAEELEQVARFQAAQLSGIDAKTMGVRLRADLLEKARATTERSNLSPEEADARIGELEKSIAGCDFTGLALEALDENFFRPALGAIEKQFGDQPLVKARLLQTLATTQRELGLLDAAKAPQDDSQVIRRRELGDEHPDTLDSIKEMGYLLWAQGRLAEAEPLLREAMEKRRRVLGNDHISTLDSIDKYGNLLRDQGKLSEAEFYSREALEGRRRVLGDEHSDTLASVANVATLLKVQGRQSEAEPYDREALEKYRRVLGEEHPHTLIAINNMAVMLQGMGKSSDSEVFYREGLEKSLRVLGHDHPDTLSLISNLAMLLKDRGKLEEAEMYCRDAVERRRRILGDDHPHTLMSISNLGTLLNDRGKLDDAEPFTREAFEKRRQIMGNEHQDTLTSMGNLSLLLMNQGKLDEAETLCREALAIRRRVLGNEHPYTLNSINTLGVLLKSSGKLEEAEIYSREALGIRRAKLGDDHRETLTSMLNLAILLKDENKLSEAEAYAREALEKCRRVLGDEHPITLSAIGNMGGLFNAQGKPQEAIDLLAPAEPAARKNFTGANAVRLSRFLAALGHARVATGEFATAEANLSEANTIVTDAKGVPERVRSDSLTALVQLYDAWNSAEPGHGHDAKATEWRSRLNSTATQAASQ